jgi:hypothetical protein
MFENVGKDLRIYVSHGRAVLYEEGSVTHMLKLSFGACQNTKCVTPLCILPPIAFHLSACCLLLLLQPACALCGAQP